MFFVDIDFETRSAVDLRTAGVYRYAEDPSTEILCAQLGIRAPDGAHYERTYLCPAWSGVALGSLDSSIRISREQLIRLGQRTDVRFCAHNASFERALWRTLGVTPPSSDRWICTAARAAAAGLPRSLEAASLALRLPVQKDASGRRLMLKCCKAGFQDTPATIRAMLDYCRQDVRVEEALRAALPPLSDVEQAIWELDAKINDRGFRVYLARAEALQHAVRAWEEQLLLELDQLSAGKVRSPKQVAVLRAWLLEQGVALKDLRKQTVSAVLEGRSEEIEEGEDWDPLDDLGLDLGPQDALPPGPRRVLEIRASLAKSSTAKLEAFQAWATEDDRIHGAYMYWGAGTGRWAGRGPQPQNMPRPSRPHAEVLAARDRLLQVGPARYHQETGGDPMQVAADSIRSLIIPARGKLLVGGDFSGVEMRVLAWLAGERGVLQLLAEGKDPYVSDAAQIYGVREDQVTPAQRQIGKVARLALGYQGAVGAFGSMSRNYGIFLPEDEVRRIVSRWRGSNGAIVAYWEAIQTMVLDALRVQGSVQSVRNVRAISANGTLRIILPSGRQLWYRALRFDEEKQLCYTSPRGKAHVYGGKFVENIVQAVSRDLLALAMLRLEEAGFAVVAHTHDEVICEVEKADLEAFKHLLCIRPSWADGLPIDAKVWSGSEYQK